MATVGFDGLYYARITENSGGDETYGTPEKLARAISAEMSVEMAEAILYSDDGVSIIIKEFGSGTLTLGIEELGKEKAAILTGAKIDSNNVLISSGEDSGEYVAVGFRAKKANGKYKYYWLYRVKFGIPAVSLSTKADTISFSTPSIEGTFSRRNKIDANGKRPWGAVVNEDDAGVPSAVINEWYEQVYEPTLAPEE